MTGGLRDRLTLASGLAGLGFVLTLVPGVLAMDESWGLGALFALRQTLPAPPSVVVVGIDRDAAVAMGQTAELDTWSRALHARVVEQLAAAGASVVAFDLVFDDARDVEGDEAFARALASAGNVVLAERTETDTVAIGAGSALVEQRSLPLDDFEVAALATAPFVLPRVPVRVGQFWTFGLAAADAPSLPVVALQAHLLPFFEDLVSLVEAVAPGATVDWPRTRAALVAMRLGPAMRIMRGTFVRNPGLAASARARARSAEASSPATAAALRALIDLYAGATSRYLNFYGPARAVATLPYDRVVAGQYADEIAGKAVFVGLTERRESAQEDDFYSIFSEPTGRNLSGVEIGATAFANLLEGRSVRPLSMATHLALVLAFGAVFGAVAARLSTAHAAAVALVFGAVYTGVSVWQFTAQALWLPLAVPLLAQLPGGFGYVLWRNYRALAQQRERVHTALGYYVPQALARRLAEQTVSLGAGRQLLHGTCLYTDAEHYTTVAEALSPTELATLMNDYYRALFRVVEDHGGQISDTAGDSMVAVWASARPDPATHQRAAEAARAMVDAVDAFNARQPRWRLPTRIGLESGELLLGNIGAEQRYEYRAIGDIVNTAARIQDLNQDLGTRVLISAATLEGTAGLRTRPLGDFLLRGKRLPVAVHELVAAAPADDEALAAFAAALAVFQRGAWTEAEGRFSVLAAELPHDGPTRYYRELARRYRDEPPPLWTGAVPAGPR